MASLRVMEFPKGCAPQVLVVEDDAVWANLLLTGLETQVRVDQAQTLAEARDFLEDRVYDLVVTDLKLGVDSGLGVPQLARRQNPNTRILLVSGHPSLADIAIETQADAWLSKPVHLKELRTTVANLLARKRRIRPGRLMQTLPSSTSGRASTHEMSLYTSDEERLETASAFVADGFRKGERCIAVVEQCLHQQMKEFVLRKLECEDSSRLLNTLQLLSAERICEQVLVEDLPSRSMFTGLVPDLLGSAGSASARTLRFYGEGVGLLVRRGFHRAAIQLETLWNEALPTEGVRMLCTFAKTDLVGASCSCLRDLVDQHDLCSPAV